MPYILEIRQKVMIFVENSGTISSQRKKYIRKDKILSKTTKLEKKMGSKSLVYIDKLGF